MPVTDRSVAQTLNGTNTHKHRVIPTFSVYYFPEYTLNSVLQKNVIYFEDIIYLKNDFFKNIL